MSSASEHPEPFEAVPPAAPIAPWFGGKKYLARRIIERIEAAPHTCYAEPFVGLGGVFLRRGRRPKAEVLNDINGEIVNLFRIVREHPDELARQFDWALSSRAEFRRFVLTPADILTDVQRAARFVYLQRLSFGGKPATEATAGAIGLNAWHPAKVRSALVQRLIGAAHTRLQGVTVECLEWDVFIRRYDRPWTFFYIDPPYWGHETDYGKGIFSREDFAEMAALLRGLKGRFILSLNDRPEVRECFAGFAFEEVETRYSANARSTRRAAELLISGGANAV